MGKKDFIKLQFTDTGKQAGGNDCGVFAVAFAVSLCLGELPENVCFDQDRMRDHLVMCLEKQTFSMFPCNGRRQPKKFHTKTLVPVYCICRLPSIQSSPLIKCSRCKRGFHGKHCIKTPDDAWIPGEKWFCSAKCYNGSQ